MAIYCPMYDPAFGWYILVCHPKGIYKKKILSPLYYYHSMGVQPPVGSKFTQQEYNEFDLDLLDESYSNEFSTLGSIPPAYSFPLPMYVSPFSSLTALISFNSSQTDMPENSFSPPLHVNPSSSLAAPTSSTLSQASKKLTSEIDDLYNLKDPLLSSTAGSASAYYPIYDSSTLSASLSSKLSATDTMLKNMVSLNKKLEVMENVLFPLLYGKKSGSSLPFSSGSFIHLLDYTSAMSGAKFTDSLAYPSATNGVKIIDSLSYPSATNESKLSSNSPFSLSPMSYLSSIPVPSSPKQNNLTLPSTSSNSSQHLHSLPPSSSGLSNALPSLDTLTSHDTALMANSSPMQSTMYDEATAYEMYLDDVYETELEEGVFVMSEL